MSVESAFTSCSYVVARTDPESQKQAIWEVRTQGDSYEKDLVGSDRHAGVRLPLNVLASGYYQLTVTGATLSKSTGAITVTGTIVCTAGDVFSVGVNIVQSNGGHSGLTGGATVNDHCSGGVDTWVAPQRLDFGSIKNGAAQVIATAFDITSTTTENLTVHQPVTPVP
jgi:hypothetical protein